MTFIFWITVFKNEENKIKNKHYQVAQTQKDKIKKMLKIF